MLRNLTLIPIFFFAYLSDSARAGVVISEMQAAPNVNLVQWNAEAGPTQVGYGPVWQSGSFDTSGWRIGRAPFGFGDGYNVGTNVKTDMGGRTPTLYIRRTVNLTGAQASRPEALQVRVRYDDGFVLWINGREVTRANLGPAGQHVYHHQVTYRAGVAQTSTLTPAVLEFSPGAVSEWLKPGDNVVAAVVSNRNLGLETGSNGTMNNPCFLDVELSTLPGRVETVLNSADFAESNGASRVTRQLSNGTVQTTATGTPVTGSWLAQAADPVFFTDGSVSGISVTAGALTGAGSGAAGEGSMRWRLTQSSPGLPRAEFRSPPLALPADRFTSGMTEADVARLSLTFRAKLGATTGSGTALFGFRMDAPGGVGLMGFPDIEYKGVPDPAPNEYASFFGGARTLKVSADGTATVSSSGLLRGNPQITAAAGMRGGAFRMTEDNSTNAGNGATAGALKCEVTTAPTVADEVRMAYPGLTTTLMTAGEISVDQFVNLGLTVALKAPSGRVVRVFLEPDVAGVTAQDQLNFSPVTGTGSWQVQEFSLASGTDAESVRTRWNTLKPAAFRLGVAFSGSLPVGQTIWLDRAGIATLWRTFRMESTNASAFQFLEAINAAAKKEVTAVFTSRTNPVSPAEHSLTVDDVRLTYRESGGVKEDIVAEGASGWRYFPGYCEPSGGVADPASFALPDYNGDWEDWIELHNDGTTSQNLTGWYLTDDLKEPKKWPFPAGKTIPAGGYLVIMADGKTDLPGANFLHTTFGLNAGGGNLALVNPSGIIVSGMLDYPTQDGFHTWGLGGNGVVGYLSDGTPGAANQGTPLPAHCDKPDFSVPGGFQDAAISLSMASETIGGEIRYTTDGTEPVETSTVYTGPIALASAGKGLGHCIRARTFKSGSHPSNIRTATYLIGQDTRLRSAPALCLSGDEGITFFKPYGVTAIEGGSRPNALWQADTITDYNNALGDVNNPLLTGQAWERPVTFEYLPGDGTKGFNEEAGIRVSGSPFSRPRYELENIATLPWSYTNLFEKPSFNFWWRKEYGNSELEYPIFGEGYPVEKFEHLRIRGGHNDMPNPFVKDELVRRLYIAMGRQGSRGTFNPLFVNAKFAGIYNLCERVREPFMRQHFGGKNKWDVIQRSAVADGDTVAFEDLLARADGHLANPDLAHYAALEEVLDVDAFVDYLLLNCWAGTGDWPHNNWIASRERVAGGKWRWFPWDAEGSFGGFSKSLGYNIISQDLLVDPKGLNREICRVYSSLRLNPEFRLKFADSINRNLCNGGALTDARLTALKTQVVNEYRPLLAYILSATVNESFFSTWVSASAVDRRDALFRSAVINISGTTADYGYQFPVQNLWPALEGKGTWQAPLPPIFSQQGGTMGPGFKLGISHTVTQADRSVDNPYRIADSQSPANRVIYYTTDGTDPRLPGGAVSGAASVYAGAAVALPERAVTVKARIRNAQNSEWSPLTAADFQPSTIPASAENVVIAEIMYHPPDATAAEPGFSDQDDFEFVRLLNTGSQPVDLRALRFTVGIDFNFDGGSVASLDPGQSVLVVSKLAVFQLRYGATLAARVAGQYSGNLSNSGERLRLEDSVGNVIQEFTYDDAAPWPATPDGAGPSLVLRDPMSRLNPTLPESWMASAVPGGLGAMSAPMNYARWRDFLWPAGTTTGNGTADDPDGDGLPNFMEYAMGSDPLTAAPLKHEPQLVQESGGNYLSLSWYSLAGTTDTDITVEAGDGQTWAAGPPAVVEIGTPQLQPDGRLLHRWRDTAPTSQHDRRFLRLRASSK